MSDETRDLTKTLVWACGMVLQSGPEDRQRIALAYGQAQELVAGIEPDNGDARPRIVACVGWILTAIQERVNEKNLLGWSKLRKLVNGAIELLPVDGPTVH